MTIMSLHSIYISISLLSLFLIDQFSSQTGAGCFLADCEHRGQVRIDAIFGPTGEWLGGCNCRCADNACPPPAIPNFNPVTLFGDCSCVYPQKTPPLPSLINLPLYIPSLDVLCDAPGPCSCPAGTAEPCIITCEGDGCTGGDIKCNNDGYPCSVDCVGSHACSGTVHINGPIGSALTVNCVGDHSCDAAVSINAATGTDLFVNCDGMESCLGEITLNFGNGKGEINCNAEAPSCQSAIFNSPKNAKSFACKGISCPTTAKQFSNVVGVQEVLCAEPGDCSCPVGTQSDCIINCFGENACKDGLIECNNDGFDCFVNCVDLEACSGTANIVGPANSDLTVQCLGDVSCRGSSTINAEISRDLTVVCHGVDSCTGYTQLTFGTGMGTVWCSDPGSCTGITFTLPPDADITPGISFSCKGEYCPADTPKSFINILPTTTASPTTIPSVAPTSRPTTPSISPTLQPSVIPTSTPITLQPSVPPTVRQTILRPSPVIPAVAGPAPTTPTIPLPPGMTRTPTISLDALLTLDRSFTSLITPWCCTTKIPFFTPFYGRCWDKLDPTSCDRAPTCVWNENLCFSTAPKCTMTGQSCIADSDCCSTVCRTSASAYGLCR